MQTILVTGGAGFVGSHTCFTLLKNNYKVVVIDSLVNSSSISLNRVVDLLKNEIPKIEENLKFVYGDLRNLNFLQKLFKDLTKKNDFIYGVIHFAGLKAVEESTNQPLLYWENNLFGTINLLKTMKLFSCHKIIFSSSATIYSNRISTSLSEDFEINPINPYGNTKFAIERLLEDLFRSSIDTWNICNLRYFNPIGAHPSGMLGEDPLGVPNNIFPLILKVASGEIPKLGIFGNDWSTPDGTCVRDFIHIMDLAEGHVKALKKLLNKESNFINLNLGTGVGTSVLSLVKTFEKANNLNIPYYFTKRREGDLPSVVADNTKSKDQLAWTPKRNIQDMCRDGWRWKKLNPNGFKE